MHGEAMRPRIDDTIAELIPSWPSSLRRDAERLPYRLGLTRSPEGRWEDFVVMDPNRDLPRYAAEDPTSPGLSRVRPEVLHAYRRAHHCAAAYGLIDDRLTDGQVSKAASLVLLREELRRAWTRALGEATGSPARARAVIAAALRSTKQGNQREQRALARARRRVHDEKIAKLSPVEYVSFTCDKLRWFGASAHALLLSLGERRRALALRAAYDTFSVALQCIDDAMDDGRDRETRGASFPDALGLPANGLLAAAPGLVHQAAAHAHAAQFHELSQWLTRVATTFEQRPVPGDPLQNAIAALILQSAMSEVHDAH